MDKQDLIIVSDFDGTITTKDIGNELCLEHIPELFKALFSKYSSGELNLIEFQKQVWSQFPMSKDAFYESIDSHCSIRSGYFDFLDLLNENKIRYTIASCGLDFYINYVWTKYISTKNPIELKECISNIAHFNSDNILSSLSAPTYESHPKDSSRPLHKGLWAKEMAAKHNKTKIIALGNGGSDKTFINHVDHIYATEKLDTTLKQSVDNNQSFTSFEDYTDIIPHFKELLNL